MDFDPSTAKEIGFEYSFDPSTAKPVEAVTFDPSTARPVHDWGTTDARDHRATYVSPPVKNSNTLFSEGSLDRTRLAAESAISVHPLLGRSIGAMEAAEAKRRRAYIANKEMEDTPENRKGIADLEAAHADKVAKYILLRNGLNEDMLAANPSFMENLVGAIGPGLIDPLNIVPISQGKTATQAALKGLAAGVGFGVAGTYEQGAFDRSIGLNKDDPTVKELLEAGVDSGVIVAALSVLTHRFGKPQVKKESVVDSIEADAKAYIEKKASPTKDVDTSNARAPQYLGKKSPATIATENRASDYAAKEGIPYEPATGTLDLKDARGRYDPDFFDTSELAAAEAKANRAAQATSNLPQAADVMMGIPDVRDGDIRSPYMTPEETARAQAQVDKTGEPAHSYMEIPTEAGFEAYWPDKMLERAKNRANKAADTGFGNPVDESIAPPFTPTPDKAPDVDMGDVPNAKLYMEPWEIEKAQAQVDKGEGPASREMGFTDNYPKWVEGTKVATSTGIPKEVYHVSDSPEGFYKHHAGKDGFFSWFSENREYGKKILYNQNKPAPTYLSIKNPIDFSGIDTVAGSLKLLKEKGVLTEQEVASILKDQSIHPQNPTYSLFANPIVGKKINLVDKLNAAGFDGVKLEEVNPGYPEVGKSISWLITHPDQAWNAEAARDSGSAWKVADAFLKAASKKQGGAIDLTQFTGPGFRDLADTVKQSADNLWNMVPDGYKVIFKGAYWADEKGTPSPLFHSTNALEEGTRFTHKEKAFGKYDPRRGDGMLIHVGTPDAAEIKNNYFARTEQNYKTLDGATINFDSLQSRMDAAGLHGDDPFSNSPTIKAVRDQWYADMSAKMELGRSKDTQLFYTSLLKLKEEIKQSGTKNYYDKVLVRKGTSAAQEAVMEAAGIGPDTLRSMLKDIKESGVSDVADALGRRLETRALATIPYKWSSKSNTHVRPMFSSAKNPLFVKDFGNWESPAQIADYLATVPKKDIDGMREQFHKKSKMSVLHPKDILGPEKFAEFQREMRKLSDDFIEQGASEQQNKRVQNFERLYGTLERYGFDHFASENQFERLHPAFQNKATAAEADIPSISLAFWDPKYLHDWADVPRQKQPFVPKSQRGSLNVGEIAKGVSEQYDNAADLLKAFKGKLTDIPFSKKLLPITANQAGEWFKNPLIEWTYNYLRRIDNTIDVRANYNKAYLKDVIDFFKRDRNGALDMVNTLVKIQEPELKAARQWAEDNNAREAFLKEHGMPDHQIPHAIKILNVMKATGLHDQETAYKLREHNFHMEPMYFPKEHTGPFTVYVTKPDGTVVHAQPFDHIVGAREYEKAFKKAAEGQDLIVSLERNEAGTLGNTYAILNQSADQLPEFLRDLNKNLLKEIEIRKRKFEMERSAENVTGATGESIYHSSSEFLGLVKRPGKWQFDQDQRALSLLQRRLEQSYALEKTARIIKEIKEPLLDDPFALVDKDGNRMSELTTYLHQLLAREQGLDISKIQQLQRDSIDAAMNSFGKQVDRVAGMSRGYKGGDISYFKPNEVARVIQAYTWFMSVVKLGWSIPVLAANASTALITPIDGFRTAAREGISQTISLLAGQKAMLAPFDADAIKWLHQADLEGMVEPRISDPMTFVETHTRSAMDKAVNFARDAIEKKTNQAALMYYYNFYKLAYPELSPNSAAFKTKVYKAARSWTGDYTSSAQLMQLSQLGYVGQLHSNFAKWKYNQIGRLANDIQMLGEGNIVPFAITMGVGVLLAGAIGAPIMAEYEALRRLLFTVSGGSIDWKPFPEFLYDSREWIRKNMGEGPAKIAQSLERGPISYGASQLGDMPDLSNSLRYSSLMDVSTLPFSFGGDLYKGMNVSLKALWNIAQRENITQQQAKDITKMLPVVVGKPVNELVENRIQTGAWFKPGYVKQFSTQDRGKYRRTPAEKAMAFAGFTSYNENTFGDRITGKEWNDRRVKTLIGKQVDRMVSNLNHPHVLQDAAEKIFEEKGITGVEAAIQAVIKQKQENQMSYLEQELAKSINITDPIAKAKILEALKKFQPAK